MKDLSAPAILSRRTVLSAALGSATTLAVVPRASLAALTSGPSTFPPQAQNEHQIPFTNDEQPQDMANQVVWQKLRDWHTPAEQLYEVSHYEKPADVTDRGLRITGMVDRPTSLTLEQIRGMRSETYTAVLECGGNGASARFSGAIGNMKWTGTRLLPILERAGIDPDAIEVVFFGEDKGEEEIRGNTYEQQFARSLPLREPVMETAMLCYEINGMPLSMVHGSPLRLVVPGWYGVAWVKWLNRIDLVDRRYVGRFMSRDYVTLRGEETEGGTVWHRTLVGPINIKSITARTIRQTDGSVRIEGAAWTDGTPLRSVQISIDGGSWVDVVLQPPPADATPYTWTFWSYVWINPTSGSHTIVSRAIDTKGRVQPSTEDPQIAMKRTYWEASQQVVREIELTE
ncbi:MAG: molybdopterin-dependent oxidoreductase [Vicinamibacterales bacterium]|nr:molybdopterin-dependent oxidoreductase [Vicinamibacterales bacterium]